MNIVESKFFGDIPQPQTFIELVGLINESDRVFMWRGQGDLDWRIDSSAYRRLVIEKPNATENDLKHYEEGLLKRATHKGLRYHDGRTLHDMELLALLQHHGAATRLLDFSRNALVALWFCCSSEEKSSGLLFGHSTEYLGGYEGEPNHFKYKEHFEDLDGYMYPQTWEPPVVSNRVAAQHSQFLYSAVGTDDSGSFIISSESDASLAIAISPELKREALVLLQQTFDITIATLFPDLDGFCDANSHKYSKNSVYRW
jgi:hypothetical protein